MLQGKLIFMWSFVEFLIGKGHEEQYRYCVFKWIWAIQTVASGLLKKVGYF